MVVLLILSEKKQNQQQKIISNKKDFLTFAVYSSILTRIYTRISHANPHKLPLCGSTRHTHA